MLTESRTFEVDETCLFEKMGKGKESEEHFRNVHATSRASKKTVGQKAMDLSEKRHRVEANISKRESVKKIKSNLFKHVV